MTTPPPDFIATQFADIVVVAAVLAVSLLALATLADRRHGRRRAQRAELVDQLEHGHRLLSADPAKGPALAPNRAVWLVHPDPAASGHVPAELEVEAPEVLDILRALDCQLLDRRR